MKRIVAIAVIAGLGIGASSIVYADASPAPKAALNDPLFAGAHWDDDDRFESPRNIKPLPVPNAAAIRKVGIVRVTEVERDDGRLEVEGYDAQGREIDVIMDLDGKRVLSSHIDRDTDD